MPSADNSLKFSLVRAGMPASSAEEIAADMLTSEQLAAFNEGNILDATGGVVALSEVAPIVTITATGTAKTGAGLFGGVAFRAVSGTVTLTIYDALSATGTPIMTITAAALAGGNGTGYYAWAGNKLRPLTTGLHVVLSGGGTFTADILVS